MTTEGIPTGSRTFRLGALDQAPIREGGTPADAIRESTVLAQRLEALGYSRFWLAEHHNSTGLACAAPEVLISHVAANTSNIRVGSGGVMLTHYSSLKVAEQFRMLETLHPGRIDLGIGRAPGSDGLTAHALSGGRGMMPIEVYPRQVEELVQYLTDTLPADHPFAAIHAMPTGEGLPEVWCLGSSLDSAVIAARYGLPFSYAHFINPEIGERAVDLYRTRYQPSEWFPEPRVSAGVITLCAPTEEEAVRLSWSRFCWRFRRGRIPSVEDALAFEYSPAELDYVEHSRSRAAIGEPKQVRERLETLAADLGAEELILLTTTFEFAARLRSYELVAEAFGMRATAS